MTEKPGRPGLQVAKYQTWLKKPCVHRFRTFCVWRSAPVRVECECGTQLLGLQGPDSTTCARTQTASLQESRPCQSLFRSLLLLAIRRPLWPVFLSSSSHSALRGLPCLGSFSVILRIRHTEGAPWVGSYSVCGSVRRLQGCPGWGPTLNVGVSGAYRGTLAGVLL